MTELAKADLANVEYVSLQDIADQHNVSAKYLSQLAGSLKEAQLIISKEGKNGGYHISTSPHKITLRDIVEAIDGPVALVRCMADEHHCPAETTCASKPVWVSVKKEMYDLLQQKTLAELI